MNTLQVNIEEEIANTSGQREERKNTRRVREQHKISSKKSSTTRADTTQKPRKKYINILLYIKHVIKRLHTIRRNYMTKRRENKQGESKKREVLKSKTPIKHK